MKVGEANVKTCFEDFICSNLWHILFLGKLALCHPEVAFPPEYPPLCKVGRCMNTNSIHRLVWFIFYCLKSMNIQGFLLQNDERVIFVETQLVIFCHIDHLILSLIK